MQRANAVSEQLHDAWGHHSIALQPGVMALAALNGWNAHRNEMPWLKLLQVPECRACLSHRKHCVSSPKTHLDHFPGRGTGARHLIFLSLRIRWISICENTLNAVMSTTVVIFTKLPSSAPSFCLYAFGGEKIYKRYLDSFTPLSLTSAHKIMFSFYCRVHVKRVIPTH